MIAVVEGIDRLGVGFALRSHLAKKLQLLVHGSDPRTPLRSQLRVKVLFGGEGEEGERERERERERE